LGFGFIKYRAIVIFYNRMNIWHTTVNRLNEFFLKVNNMVIDGHK